ncbi:MAG TPA: hypothetical protein VF773_10850 [Verrucomicrobiae bacterium]
MAKTNAGAEGAKDNGAKDATTPTLESLQERIASLEKENKSLRQQLRFGTEIPEEIEALVQEKINAGLPREQAIEVVKNQLAHDAKLLKAEKEAKKNS